MPYEIELSSQARKTFDRVDRPTRVRFLRAMADLRVNPHSGPNITQLSNHHEGTHRYRVGGWRLIYRIEANRLIVVIEKIGPRGDTYKR